RRRSQGLPGGVVSTGLSIDRLDAGYARLPVLRAVDLVVEPGTITSLLGPNGAGKTTLLRAICGLAKVYRGQVTVGDERITGARAGVVVAAGVGFVPAGRQLFRSQSVESNLDLGMFGVKLTREERAARIERMCAMFPILDAFRTREAGLLSGGQQQMLALAQVLIREPKVLLLDEPSLGLAPAIVGEVFETLRSLRTQGMTTLIVEQAVESAIDLADRVYVMAGGSIVLHGEPDHVRNHPALTEAFLGSTPTTTERNLLP
ncbi:MAG: transporter ATP-binding protein, partial [Ilumatobacteraceae bacterium]|nr:transporter ATP-binding protein [Ilumatobacteraceae bacterium]